METNNTAGIPVKFASGNLSISESTFNNNVFSKTKNNIAALI